MPELPEVETVCRGIESSLLGQTIVSLSLTRRKIRFDIPKDIEARCHGKKIIHVRRRGKYILLDLSNEDSVIIHLGMSGRILINKSLPHCPRDKHDHAVFVLSNGAHMTFRDPRRFGLLSIDQTADLPRNNFFKKMGVEPLSNDLNELYLSDQLKNRSGPIKNILLDQKIIAGLGNIYVCEALYTARISPLRPAKSLTPLELDHLIFSIRDILQKAIDAGGSSLRDFKKTNGEMGYFQFGFHVYDQEGQACPHCQCDIAKTTGIKRLVQAGRSTFYCATRQK